jgi:hypothetical protein
MTTPPKKVDTFELLLDSHLAELMAMTDEEILDGKDAASIRAQGLRMLDSAKAEAGRQRLAVAKAKLEEAKSRPAASSAKRFSAAEARAILLKASNDPRYTLAARGLDEMSDEDAIRLCEQLAHLESSEDETPRT